jgi:ATP-binding cassette subfamily F protein uup
VTSVLVSEDKAQWTEYAGGYSDMIAQRGPGIAAGRAVKPGKSSGGCKPSGAVGAPKSGGGFSFKDRDALAKLPATINALHKSIAKLQAELADPDLYRRDPAKFEKTSATLSAKSAELEAAEERWLELEMLREVAEG